MIDVLPDLQRALVELGKHPNLLSSDPDSWFFEVTNPLEEDASCSNLTRDLVNMVASALVVASRA